MAVGKQGTVTQHSFVSLAFLGLIGDVFPKLVACLLQLVISALSLLKGISIGFKSGEYWGRYRSVAPRANRLAYASSFVRRKIVDHDDILALEGRAPRHCLT
jgi:hypothetical protein